MNDRILLYPEAQRDLDEQVVFIGEFIGERNFEAAERFEAAVKDAMKKLALMPGMGALRDFPNPRLAGMRSWPVKGFENHIICYRPMAEGIEVIRILYGTRDLDRIFRR